MFEYKSEVLATSIKWVSYKVSDADVSALDQLIHKRATEGLELVTSSYMATTFQIRGATLVTFRKPK